MRLLKDLPNNTRVCIFLEPLWAVFGTIIIFYAPLYMKELGVTEIQIGLIFSVNLYFSAMLQFFAGPITNKLGRKKTSFIFDLISWSIPMLIWAIAQNFWYFLIAYSINACSKIVAISWNCLVIEDVDPRKTSKVFGILNAIIYAGGAITPIFGMLMTKNGTIPTMRLIYILAFISMTAMFIIRNKLVNETEAGIDLINKHKDLNILQSIKNYFKTVFGSIRNVKILPIILIYILTTMILQMNFFQVVYLTDFLKFSTYAASYSPVITGIVALIFYFFAMPKLQSASNENNLVKSLFLCVIGSVMFVLVPQGNFILLVIALFLLAAGFITLITYRDATLMNRLGKYEKADMFSAIQTVTTIVCIPTGYLSGLLFTHFPRGLFIVVAVFYGIVFCISVFMKHQTEHLKSSRSNS